MNNNEPTTNTERVRKYKQRRMSQGWVPLYYLVPGEMAEEVREYIKGIKERHKQSYNKLKVIS